MKATKIILSLAAVLLVLIALAGMYKFNYLSGKPGYDVDGNKIDVSQLVDFESCVKAGGSIAESWPRQCFFEGEAFVEVLPDDQFCDQSGGEWKPVGKLQEPMCVYGYSDAGKTCSASSECEGKCIVTEIDGSNPQCAANNNPFGCKSSIEDFNENGGILCID